MLQITTIMDNEPSENKALINEHGLSYYIVTNGKHFLFDCGSGDAILYNAHKLGINLKNLEGVILSHNHYDHAAGYRDLIEHNLGGTKLYTGNHFWDKKYATDGTKYTDLSAGFDKRFLKEHSIDHIETDDVTKISDNVYLVTNFTRIYDKESIPNRFVKLVSDENSECTFTLDTFDDEQCVVIDTDKGLIVLVGCSHPGICNMIEKIHDRFSKNIYALYGGTHLVEADQERISFTIQLLKKYGLKIIGLGHCSGNAAEKEIEKDHSIKGCHLCVGDSVFMQ